MEWRPDWGLRARMALTMVLLFGLYLAFVAAMVLVFDVGLLLVALLLGSFSLVQFFFSDRLTLWSMGAREVDGTEFPELHRSVERLAWEADLPTPTVAVVDSGVPNAFATGRSPSNAAVAVTTGLMQTLDRDELEGVIAHELAHIKNRDVAVMTIASFLATIAFLIVRFGGYSMLLGGRGRGGGGAAAIMVAVLISLVVWILSYILIRTLSRYREYAADRGGAAITGDPAALASALETISDGIDAVDETELHGESEMNAFFIIPLRSGLARLLSTHPPTEKRIAALEEIDREMRGF